MSAAALSRLSWDQKQHLRLLEARLIWLGEARLADLRDAFGISTRHAERDLALYGKLWPENLAFDAELGIFTPTEHFVPALLRGSASELLQVLRHHDLASELPLGMAAAGHIPAETLDTPERDFDVRVLQRLALAIRQQRWLSLDYQSMSQPEPRRLRIAPHVLVHAGRWHARAWSEQHAGFRDFLLSRIVGLPELEDACEHTSEQDWDWRNHVRVRIGPHPGLSASQTHVVEQDYAMRAGVLERSVRLALVPYYLRQMGIGRDDLERAPAEQQIVLLNRGELETFNRLG
jgi:predicted DNA-binding transcriptional regulator YafY